jgi:two-component system sensor histidine kinase PilS (NtrC family)
MNILQVDTERHIYPKLKWLMFARVLFTSLLLISTIIFQLNRRVETVSTPLALLYILILGVFIISLMYALMLERVRQHFFLAYLQIGTDTFIISLIVFVTGSYSSIFSFLYLVVIIYASMVLLRKGSLIIASLCVLQYGIMIILEYHKVLTPFGIREGLLASNLMPIQLVYKFMIIASGCYAVAFLSSLLSEQAVKTKQELWDMEDQVKRVEKLAAVGEMAAGLAHEIKNPLASLAGSIQILKDSVHLDPDHNRLMQIVLREADRLSSLVNNFLLFARPPAGKPRLVELDKAVTETVELFEKDQRCTGRIAVTKHISPGLQSRIDPIHLRQVLWNLLLNAAEAIEDDGRVNISLFATKNKTACIEISDDGCGMSAETIHSIFDPFFTTKPNGTGLGLSIVHSILETYDSHLDVRSKTDTGTTFTLTFKTVDIPT